ncbi:MAG TPA: chromate transporter [Dongiaceae bacterium]
MNDEGTTEKQAGEEDPGSIVSADPGSQVSLSQILWLFTQVGLTSFGGGLSAWIYREVVGNRRWLTEDEFLAGLTLSQILPGPNVINLSIYIGQRLQGTIGSLIAVTALLVPPMFVTVALGVVFHHFNQLAWLHNMLEGIAAAAIGMTFSMGYRTARYSASISRWSPLVTLAIFSMIGLVGWPMIPVVLCMAPLAVLFAWKVR